MLQNALPQRCERLGCSAGLLPPAEQRAYRALRDGLLHCRAEITLDCDRKRVDRLYGALRLDVPEMFYLRGLAVQYVRALPGGARCCRITVLTGEWWAGCARRKKRYAPFLQEIRRSHPMEHERRIHDLLAAGVTYRDPAAPYSHEAPGSLLYGLGVCEGIAKAFKYLADRAGVPTLIIAGTSRRDGMAHAWNLCRIGAAYYHVDVTFDVGRRPRYEFFNRSDLEMQRTHSWNGPLPCHTAR